MRAAWLAALVLAAPAAAQELVAQYDPVILSSCFDSRGPAQRESCIGLASTRCTSVPGMDTTVGTVMCLNAELEQWDRMLNDSYAKLRDRDAAIDTEMSSMNSAVPHLAPALRDMQRAWIAYRDAACLYEAAQWGGGSGAGPASVWCRMRLTARQALSLYERAETYEGQ